MRLPKQTYMTGSATRTMNGSVSTSPIGDTSRNSGVILLVGLLLITSGAFAALTINAPGNDDGNDESDNWEPTQHQPYIEPLFSGVLAEHFVEQQLEFGPRVPGSAEINATRDHIRDTMVEFGYTVEYQEFTWNETPGTNVIARLPTSTYYTANRSTQEPEESSTFIFGAHYDTRPHTDYPRSDTPIMGANDGASGVAVLLELARVLSVHPVNIDLEFVFFDLEDSGIAYTDFSQGAKVYAESLSEEQKEHIIGAVVVDMVGDSDLNIKKEKNSDPDLVTELWREADKLDTSEFHHTGGRDVFDDHRRLLNVGIPTALLIDFEYGSAPGLNDYWHTQNDTLDKISAESLEKVGQVLERFIYSKTSYRKEQAETEDLLISENGEQTIQDEVLHINGNIDVHGTLILENSMLIVNSETDREHALIIHEGGSIQVRDSIITSPTRNLKFEVHGGLDVEGSLIEQLWGDTIVQPHVGGIQVYSPAISIRDSTIRYSETRGIFFRNVTASPHPVLTNTSVLHNGEIGIYAINSSIGIETTYIEGNGRGAIVVSGGDIAIRDSSIGTCLVGGSCTDGSCSGPEPTIGIELVGITGPSVISGTSFENMDKGIVGSYTDTVGGTITVSDVDMVGPDWGIELLHSSFIIRDSQFIDSGFGITVQSSDPIIENSTFTNSLIGIRMLTSYGNLTGNTIDGAEYFGIYLERSMVGVKNGSVSAAHSGIRVYRDRGSSITGNMFAGNVFGLNGSTDDHSIPTIVNNNTLTNNHWGIYWLGNETLLDRNANIFTEGDLSNLDGDIWQEREITLFIYNATQDVTVEFKHGETMVHDAVISMWSHTVNENLTVARLFTNGTWETFREFTAVFTSGTWTESREIDILVDTGITIEVPKGPSE
jgi:glutaminyl-peptide cyclotransferase